MMRRFFVPVFLSLSLLFLFCPGIPLWPQPDTIDPFVMPSARFGALGGSHASMGDDFYAIFLNPASFAHVKDEFSAAEISLCTYGPFLEIIDLIRDEETDISGIVGQGGFAAGFDMGGPLSLGWVGRGLGLGIFNRVRTSATVSGTMMRPLVSGELLIVGGYAFKIINNDSHNLDAGFLAKGFFRSALNLETSIFHAASIMDDPARQPLGT